MNFSAVWIWKDSNQNTKKQALFLRKTFNWNGSSPAKICVTADSRYKLYINGRYVLTGPLKGDHYSKYYDTVDITSYLKNGKNCVAAHVLRMNVDYLESMEFHTGPVSLVNGSHGGFWLDSRDCPAMNTSEEWKCKVDDSYHFVEALESKYAGDQELCLGEKYERGWNAAEYDDSDWQHSVMVCSSEESRLGGVLYEWQLAERRIPLLYEKEIHPVSISRQSGAIDFTPLLKGSEVVIPPGSDVYFDLDMGELVNAYVGFPMETVKAGATVTFTYSESYLTENEAGCFYKGRRDNPEGKLTGEQDVYEAGTGEQIYEPFWFRVFRYLRIHILTKNDAMRISAPKFRLTGYPLNNEGVFQADSALYNHMWDVSVRTLERCMLDTYVDCPYYEQMQYVMDTMIETLLTYQISRDDRLARKAIHDFHSTRRPDGMIHCNAPASFDQIIPIFSIYFIDMVYYHFLYFGDKQLVSRYLPTIIGILRYFEDRLDPETGLVGDTGYWHYVDWADEWRQNHGSPIEESGEIIYVYSQMVAYGLMRCAELCGYLSLPDLHDLYDSRYQAMVQKINAFAFDEKAGLYRTHPSEKKFSQHAQLWAVLAGCVSGVRAAELMRKCMQNPEIIHCSYSMSFYLFRAFEKAGIYDEMKDKWKPWEQLLACRVTTWPEDNVTQRSDCHAWSAIPVYDFITMPLGIRPFKPGFEEIAIEPHSLEMGNMEASLPIPQGIGTVRRTVRTQPDGQAVRLEIHLPGAIPTHILTPDSKDHFYRQEEIVFEYTVN